MFLNFRFVNSVRLMINKIGVNLQKRCHMEPVLQKTLRILHDLAAGINIVHTSDRVPQLIMSGKLLLKNDMVQYILKNHASPEFRFLNGDVAFGKYRTQFYCTLSRLLFMESESQERFNQFMEPLANVLNSLWQQCRADPQSLRADQYKGKNQNQIEQN